MDANGINQHHDAVTGTARQAVADDYAKRILDAVDESNTEYSHLVGKAAFELGVEASEWKICKATNTTYLDCPIKGTEDSFAITAHNPAAVAQKVVRVKLPPASAYNVQAFNQETWEDVNTSLLCFDYLENTPDRQVLPTCELFIDS